MNPGFDVGLARPDRCLLLDGDEAGAPDRLAASLGAKLALRH